MITFSPIGRIRRIIKKVLVSLKYQISAHPKLTMIAVGMLNNFPKLKAKLKRISESHLLQQAHDRSELTLNAQKIYDDLKKLCKKGPKREHECQNGKVAIVTPVPPSKTGVADYVSELLPLLSKVYEVEIITDTVTAFDSYPVRSIKYFEHNVESYGRIIYQVGNSSFHWYMFDLIRKFPGIIILHDFYLGNVLHWMQTNKRSCSGIWDDSLLDSHGYSSVYRKSKEGASWAVDFYPVNVEILKNAKGIIVHSEYAQTLFTHWYGQKYQDKLYYLPQVHKEFTGLRTVNPQEFLVCSFGHIIKQKCIHKIISAWVSAGLDKQKNSRLVFVGGCSANGYAQEITKLVQPLANVEITGFVEEREFQSYLKNANVAVQLRENSRGETSRAVLDCLAYGVPTIINSNGAMNEFPDDVVYKTKDAFSDSDLSFALTKLKEDEYLSETLSKNSKEFIAGYHAPKAVVQKMQGIIEAAYAKKAILLLSDLCGSLQETQGGVSNQQLCGLAKEYDMKQRSIEAPSLYVDISGVVEEDLKTGIQRVVRAILISLYEMSPSLLRYKIVPVYLTNQNGYWHYRVAHAFMKSLVPDLVTRNDTVIEPINSEVFIGLDFCSSITEAVSVGLFDVWRERGVSVNFIVYDILPIQFPSFFPDIAHSHHENWLNAIGKVSDSLLCISEAVANDVRDYFDCSGAKRFSLPNVSFFHLGADIDNSLPSRGLLKNTEFVLEELRSRPSFLMVGTIEPRKGYNQTLKAFAKIWADGVDVNLVIVGKKGWMVEETVDMLEEHPELNKRLFWLEAISDEYLGKVYDVATCLISASEGEGFGLPLIEAAQKKKPMICRDIPVFREVAGEYSYYFKNDTNPATMAKAIQEWLLLYKEGKHPKSDNMPWLTWEESTTQLLKCLNINSTTKEREE